MTNETFERNDNVKRIEQHDEAIKILKKFPNVTECVVCDGGICVEEKLENKVQNKKTIYDELQPSTKEILEKILLFIDGGDPFELKKKSYVINR